MQAFAGLRGIYAYRAAYRGNCQNEVSVRNFKPFWEEFARVVISGKTRSYTLSPSFFKRFDTNEIARAIGSAYAGWPIRRDYVCYFKLQVVVIADKKFGGAQ